MNLNGDRDFECLDELPNQVFELQTKSLSLYFVAQQYC